MGNGLTPLQQYLPRLVRYWDLDAPGELHRSIEGSMVFVDISGFTKMSERLARHGQVGAEEVTEVIDNTFGRLLPEAYAFGANLLKFGGDAMLLLFSGAGHPLHAAAAALAMRRQLREIGHFSTTAGQVSLRMSVGVHTGMFDFFLVGGSHRELIVAGPAATRTVEMESTASAGQILLSPEMVARLPRTAVGRAIGPGYLLSEHLGEIDRLEIHAGTGSAVEMSQFVPSGLRGTLLAGTLDPEHRPVAVAFIHYGHFDELIEQKGGPEAAVVLDQLVKGVQEAADSRGVTFLATDISAGGGKIILTAGVPQTTAHDEEQMLLTLHQVIAADWGIPLHIGVNWGHVFAGEIGPPYRRTYTVMGDTVNLAARLMARASVGSVYATEEMLVGSRTVFDNKALDPFLVKGKRRPVQAFLVGDPAGSRSEIVASALPLLGRDQELERMLTAWRAATAGRGGAVQLVAEAGMGKSRLLEEFLARSGASNVIGVECRLYQSATPYFPFRTLLRVAWQLEGLDPSVTAARLHQIVDENAPELMPWLALIADPLGLVVERSAQVNQLADEFRPPRTHEAIIRLLETTVVEPCVFVIEDTHWMDEASRDLLEALTGGLERRPWLFVLTRRPADEGFILAKGESRLHIELQPLTDEQTKELIIAATESAPLMPRQIASLSERAQGHPLFLIELLQALRQGRDVDALPHSVEGLIGARVDGLPPADRNILRRLSVLGSSFAADHMAAVLPDITVRTRNQALRRLAGFLSVAPNGWVQFRHALIRDVAYAGLPYRTRLDLHARVADSIRRSDGASEKQAELLSLHYHQAKRWEEAWAFSRVAGDAAKRIYANLEAATFYRRALQSARFVESAEPSLRSQLAESLGDVLEQAGLFKDSLDAYRQATSLVKHDPIHHADLLLKRARARARIGAYTTAFREIAIGCRMVTEVGSREARKARARLTALSAQLRQLQEHPRAALRLAQQAMTEAGESDEKEALARSYQVLDAAYNMLGQPSRAIFGQRALELYEELGNLPGVAIVTNNLGGQAYFEGHWEVALEYYARAQDAFRRAGNEPEAATSAANIGEVLVSQGKFDEAETLLADAVRVLRAHNLVDAAIFADIQLARSRLLRGDLDALPALARIRAEAAAVGQTHSVVESSIYIGLGMVRKGDPAAALQLLAEAEKTSGGEADLYGCSIARVRAMALAGLGRFEEANATLEAGLAQARDEGLVYEEALLLRTMSELNEADGTKLLEEADHLLQQLGVIRAA
ncbi:MAG: adenylate/guanylate cyclase domain-containing protein [Acidimicrobiia bacterium]|nr:adenylate/guanylate cyclase domain-containing protein [Acidimicrobiia bacterium]